LILDRERLNSCTLSRFSNNNVFTSIDSKTGRPTVDESKGDRARNQGAEFCPSIGAQRLARGVTAQTNSLHPANNNSLPSSKGQVPDEDSKGIYVG